MAAKAHLSLLCVFTLLITGSFAQDLATRPAPPAAAPQSPNADPIYQQLRNVGLSGEVAAVNNLVLQRDAGTFTFRSGSLCFLSPVNGKVTGAVFTGDGSFTLTPPLEEEKRSLSLLTDQPVFVEDFRELVLRFTDGTYEEIKKSAGMAGGGSCSAGALADVNNALRKNRNLKYNLTARALQDVLGSEPGGLFVAFIKGLKYSSEMIYTIDPHGAPGVEPEEVSLMTYSDAKWGIWAAFHLSSEYARGTASGSQQNAVVDAEHHVLDMVIEKNGKLTGDATTTLVALVGGMRVIPLDLYRTLRVQSVNDATGQALAFIQEDKDEDADFAVVLPRPLAAGERITLHTVYSGKDAVSNEGGGNYYPVARRNWYPNTYRGDFATYAMTFRIPKGLQMVATGTPQREIDEGNQNISEWRSEGTQGVAGFNFGRLKKQEAKLKSPEFVVEAYANRDPPNWVQSLQRATESGMPTAADLNETSRRESFAFGTMDTTRMMDKPLAEAQIAVQLYTDYFGAPLYKRLAMTQQTACTYGQAWPTLIYMPICHFFDQTVQNQLGLLDGTGYWKVVAPHEVAHQWWGQTVGWKSYRDQWISEGFSELSASLYLQAARQKEPQEFMNFWKEERERLLKKNRFGNRAIDVGPVTLGFRLNNTRAGFGIYSDLVYPKGGYILHMIRMMMWDPRTGDQRFKTMMQDFVRTYANRAATTEDFKAMVEKHLPPELDIQQNGKMDWFFNEYVYGTALPNYKLEHSIEAGPAGDFALNVKITQSNVSDQFLMMVPIYLELANGRVVRLGMAPMLGNRTLEQQIPLGGLKDRPRRALLNHFYDVLSTQAE